MHDTIKVLPSPRVMATALLLVAASVGPALSGWSLDRAGLPMAGDQPLIDRLAYTGAYRFQAEEPKVSAFVPGGRNAALVTTVATRPSRLEPEDANQSTSVVIVEPPRDAATSLTPPAVPREAPDLAPSASLGDEAAPASSRGAPEPIVVVAPSARLVEQVDMTLPTRPAKLGAPAAVPTTTASLPVTRPPSREPVAAVPPTYAIEDDPTLGEPPPVQRNAALVAPKYSGEERNELTHKQPSTSTPSKVTTTDDEDDKEAKIVAASKRHRSKVQKRPVRRIVAASPAPRRAARATPSDPSADLPSAGPRWARDALFDN